MEDKHLTMAYDYLEHHGVKGQKWGVRRTVAQLKRSSASRAREKSWQDEYNKRGSMSNADLKRKLERLKLENEFKRNMVEARSNPRVKEAKEWLNAAAGITKNVSSITGNTLGVVDQVTKRLDK